MDIWTGIIVDEIGINGWIDWRVYSLIGFGSRQVSKQLEGGGTDGFIVWWMDELADGWMI